MDRPNRIGLIVLILAVSALACATPLLPSVESLPTQPAGAMNTFVAGTRAAAATQTQLFTTPSSTPTITPLPSRTPTITATPTATFIFKYSTPTLLPTSTPKSSGGGGGGGGGGSGGGGGGDGGNADDGDKEGDLACRVISTTVTTGGTVTNRVPAGARFTVEWTVRNNGNVDWVQVPDANHPDASDFDFEHYSGTIFELASNPPPGNIPYRYNFPLDPPIISPGMSVDLRISNPALVAPNESGQYKATWIIVVSSNLRFCKMSFVIVVP